MMPLLPSTPAWGLCRLSAQDHGYARFELGHGATLSIHTDPNALPSTTMIYFECADLDARHQALVAQGVVFDQAPKDTDWLWREARLRDPSGNPICLYHAGANRRFPPWRLDGKTAP